MQHALRTICLSVLIPLKTYLLFSQNVGVGTSNPTAKLDVAGTFKVVDGTQGNGKILTSDANGLASWQPFPKTTFMVATDQSVGNNDFIGMGTSSSGFSRNSLVVPFDCELTSITLSIREMVINTGIVATVWHQSGFSAPVSTSLSAAIDDGYNMISSTSTGSVSVSQGDLIGVQLSWTTGGALSEGVTASIVCH